MPSLVNARNGETLLDDLEIADSFWRRFKGLQLRLPLKADQGLLIVPCSSVHTCFMRFSIDVYMINAENVVIGYRKHVAPWRAVLCKRGTTQVLETKSGALNLTVGTHLTW